MQHRPPKPRLCQPGQTLPEYGLLIAFMCVGMFAVLQLFGNMYSDFFIDLGNQIVTLSGG